MSSRTRNSPAVIEKKTSVRAPDSPLRVLKRPPGAMAKHDRDTSYDLMRYENDTTLSLTSFFAAGNMKSLDGAIELWYVHSFICY